MGDNIQLSEAVGSGSILASAGLTFSGDAAQMQVSSFSILTGAEDAWSQTLIVGGTGVDTPGVQRVSLATDIPLPAGTNALGSIIVSALLSVVDTNNSSSSTLAEDAVFTGTATDTLNYSHITISVFADQASATDGLSVQWSTDGTNWDNTDVFTISASTPKVFSFGPVARYVRVVYTNGAVAQGAFRLQTILRVGQQSASSHRIADMISGQDDAELIKAVLTGLSPGGSFVNALVTNAGELKVSLENANGNVQGGGTEATAVRVTVASDSTGVLSIDDNGGSITVDGTVAATQSGAWNITNVSGTISLPTGAATSANQTSVIGTNGNAGPASALSIAGTDGGGDLRELAVNTSGQLIVASVGSISDNTGTNIGYVDVAGRTAEDAAITAAPVTIGARYDATERSVDDGDVVGLAANPAGHLQVTKRQDADVLRFNVLATADGDDVIPNPGVGLKVRIRSFAVLPISTTATTIYFQNTGTAAVLFTSGNPYPVAIDADGDNVAGFVWNVNEDGWFDSATANEAVEIKMPGGNQPVLVIGTYKKVAA